MGELQLTGLKTELASINQDLLGFYEQEINTDNIAKAKDLRTKTNKFFLQVSEERLTYTRKLDAVIKEAMSVEQTFIKEAKEGAETLSTKIKTFEIEQFNQAENEKVRIESEKQKDIKRGELQIEIDNLTNVVIAATIRAIEDKILNCTSINEVNSISDKMKLFTPVLTKQVNVISAKADMIGVSLDFDIDSMNEVLNEKVSEFINKTSPGLIDAKIKQIKSFALLDSKKAEELELKMHNERLERIKRDNEAAEEVKQKALEQSRLNAELEAQAKQQTIRTSTVKIKQEALVSNISSMVSLLEYGIKHGIGVDKGLREKLQSFANKIANLDKPPKIDGVKYQPKM